MIPADTEDIEREYQILLGELQRYNPEMMDKNRVLGISKADLIDAELKELLEPTLPTDLPHCFFSAVTGEGVRELKDLIWHSITVNNFHEVSPLVERNMHLTLAGIDLEDEDVIYFEESDEEDGGNAGGRMLDEDYFE